MTARVAIIGGGYAGMAASVELTAAGVPVTVFEAAQELGGRARRVTLNGMALDNGQHILLGAYRQTLELIRRVHADPERAMLRLPLELNIAGEFHLKAAALPGPLALAAGFARARGLSLGERLAAVRFLLQMKSRDFSLARDYSVAELLREAGASARSTLLLWEPLCVSALNTNIDEASAQVFLHVLQDALMGSRSDSDMVIPREDLTSLFPAPAAAWISTRGGAVRAACTIRGIGGIAADGGDGGNGGYRLEGDESGELYANVIIAVSPHRLAPLIAGLPGLAPLNAMVAAFDYQPISTCYLQYPPEVRLPAAMTGMISSTSTRIGQWAFDRNALSATPGLIAVVISASGPHQQMTQDELAARLHQELAGIVTGLPQPLWHRVIAEKRATFTCRPGLLRPSILTALPGIFLAGDYVQSRYPATLEAAVASGRTAAHYAGAA
jgi:squalene-associated FAD-dependent desaturase